MGVVSVPLYSSPDTWMRVCVDKHRHEHGRTAGSEAMREASSAARRRAADAGAQRAATSEVGEAW